jgi:hypothetical protein
MNVPIVTDSHRPHSQSKRIGNLLKAQYLNDFKKIFVHHLADMRADWAKTDAFVIFCLCTPAH